MIMGKKIVMTFGTFDIFHPGHSNFLSQAKEHGDQLITIIATDNNVTRFKGQPPQNDQRKRQLAVIESGLPDIIEIGDEINPMKWVDYYKPDIIFLGYDQVGFIDKLKQMYPEMKIVRGKPHFPERYKSSLLRRK